MSRSTEERFQAKQEAALKALYHAAPNFIVIGFRKLHDGREIAFSSYHGDIEGALRRFIETADQHEDTRQILEVIKKALASKQ